MPCTATPKSQQARKANQPFLETHMQWNKSIATLVACFIMAMALTACGGGTVAVGSSPQTQTPIDIFIPPDSQSVVAGQSATFSIFAISNETLSYQWKKNGTNINGATSRTYTTPPTSNAD
ncbi:MAG: immunoglobulin domain-containing protein, partial [Rhodoferax sp.]|nr:immunoglobulin domain-containing protein [Rhodoferax sp.]